MDDDWEIGKLKEAGGLATERLESISGVKPKVEKEEKDGFNWRWAFLIALAVVVFGGVIAFIALKRKNHGKQNDDK